MTNDNSEEIERLADQIVEYVSRNPLAADTLAGIESWWLSAAKLRITSSNVEKAVRLLLLRGILTCNIQPDGTKTYLRAHHSGNGHPTER